MTEDEMVGWHHQLNAYEFEQTLGDSGVQTCALPICQRIDVCELWCWRRLLRVPWTARRSSQSILKEINPEYSLGGLMPKLKLQYLAT